MIKKTLARILGALELLPAGLIGLALELALGYYISGFDGQLEGGEIVIADTVVVIGSFGSTWIDNRFRTGERISAWWRNRS